MVMATGAEESTEADALREVLRHLADHRFVTARLAGGRDGGGDRGGGCGGRCGGGCEGRCGGRHGGGCGGFRFAGRFPGRSGRRAQELWPALRACDGATLPYGGISAPAATPADLNGAPVQARYALTAARRAEGPNLTAVVTSRPWRPCSRGSPPTYGRR